MLAGVSLDYYTRLEQGRERHPSTSVVDALARVFMLSSDAAAYLGSLAAPASCRPRPPAGRDRPQAVPGLLKLMAAWPNTPAFVVDAQCDVLACTPLAAAVHPGLARESNMIRLMFLDAEERAMYLDWETTASTALAWLRSSTGRYPENARLTELIDDLRFRSAEFAKMWSRHDVGIRSSGTKRLLHPLVGHLEVNYETLTINQSAGQSLIVYHADPGTRTARSLDALLDGTHRTVDHSRSTPVLLQDNRSS